MERIRELYLASFDAQTAGDFAEEARLLDLARAELLDSPRLDLLAAQAHAAAGHSEIALDLLARSVERGVGLDAEEIEQFASLSSSPRFAAIRTAIANETQARGFASVAATSTERDLMPEGLAVDSRTGIIYLSSLHKGKIVALHPDGSVRDFVSARQDGLWCTLGLRVDLGRNRLWVASSGQNMLAEVGDDEIGRAGLFAFDLADGSLRERHLLDTSEVGHLLNDLTLDGEGNVFVTDTVEGSVWQRPAEESRLDRLTPPGAISGANGIALSPDDSRIYVAWDFGIAIFDRRTHEIRELAPPVDASLTGIDGLELFDGSLIAIQTEIERVSRFSLAADGESVVAAETLLARHHLLDFPTTGDLIGNEFFFIANARVSSVDVVGSRSVPWPAERLHNPVVLRIELTP